MRLRQRTRWTRTLVMAAVEMAVWGAARAQAQAVPEPAPAPAATPAPAAEPAPERIVVSGTRASLLRARELKRNSAVVQDSIAAEDLGRFPDDNVADSLSHVTGVTISRTHGGEGQYVNVRGLGPNYSIVTLNGRILATDGDGREFAFDVLPSETIFGADVMKSAEASQIEGSIGGSVNLRSARALNNPGRVMRRCGSVVLNDLSETGGGKISGVWSDTFANNTVGLVLGAVYGQQRTRSDSVLDYSYNPDAPGEFDANGDGQITPTSRTCSACAAWPSAPSSRRRSVPPCRPRWSGSRPATASSPSTPWPPGWTRRPSATTRPTTSSTPKTAGPTS